MVKIREKIKKLIVKTIEENEGNGANEIFDIIIKKYGNIVSKPTYFKKLKELKEEKETFEIPDSKGKKSKLVSLSRKKDIERISRQYLQEFKKFRLKLEKYEKLKPTLSDKEKISLYVDFHLSFWIIKWKLTQIPESFQKPTIKKLEKNLKELESEIFLFFIEYPDYTRITNLASQKLTEHYFELSEKIDEIMDK